MKRRLQLAALALFLFLILPSSSLFGAPLGTAFTYQGRLNDGSGPVNSSHDLRFTLNDAATGPAQIGSALTNAATPVSNGLFTVTLDFGAGMFTGGARWLEIGVRASGSPADFATLAPRQPLTPAPYVLYAPNAGTAATANSANAVAANSVANAGLQAGAVTSDKIADGTITAGDLSPALASNTFWRLGGNAATVPGSQFLGTTDNQPLELRVNNQRALLLSGQPGLPPNLVVGVPENGIPLGIGSVIAGGGHSNMPHKISSSWGVIGGGLENVISSNAHCATIAGGNYNSIEPCPSQVGAYSYGSIGGGVGNGLETNATFSTIAGGWLNRIQMGASSATIAGGRENRISPGSFHTTIGGGIGNQIQNDSPVATIGGGYRNTILTNGSYATIPGGRENSAASYAFAAGRRAKADHTGAFVWADSQDSDFASTAPNQFLIRATGGVGLNKSNPATALDVNGTVTAAGFSGPGGGLTGISTASLADNAVTSAKLASDAASLAKVSGGAMASGGGSIAFLAKPALLDNDLYLRNDLFHGLGWYGAGKLFGGANVNGPVLYGWDGGGLGTFQGGGSAKLALTWNATGSVGIGKTNPATALDVNGAVKANSFFGATNLTMAGCTNTGLSAVALGTNTTASGNYSAALGKGSIARGLSSIALGDGSWATGDYSTAIGSFAAASTNNSIALGANAYAANQFAFAEGRHSTASGYSSIAMGDFARAEGDHSIALGDSVTSTGRVAVAMGSSAKAFGDFSTALGWYSTARGMGSTALGNQTTAGGSGSLAGGANSTASGDYSVALGQGAVASGEGSVALNGEATGGYSFAVSGGRAGGWRSFAAGQMAETTHNNCFVWNDGSYPAITSTGERQFLIGAAGGVGINKNNPTSALDVNGAVKANNFLGSFTGSFSGPLRLNDDRIYFRGGSDTFHGLGWYSTGSFAGANPDGPVLYGCAGGTLGTMCGGAAWALTWNSSGNVAVRGTISQGSDRSAKTDFAAVQPREMLEKVTSLPVQSWRYSEAEGVRHVGPVAQDFHAAFGLGENDTTITTVDEGGVALAAIQGLNEKVESGKQEAESRIERLEQTLQQKQTEIAELRQRLEKLEQFLNYNRKGADQ